MVEFNNKVKARVSERWVNLVVEKILGKLDRKGDVSVALVGDMEIKKINKEYRKRDEVTDVLSFSNLEGKKLVMPKGSDYLGEVIIAYGQAKRQALNRDFSGLGRAKEQGHIVKKELTILLIHGVLHLLGYEHEEGGREAEVMRKKEVELLGMFKINN